MSPVAPDSGSAVICRGPLLALQLLYDGRIVRYTWPAVRSSRYEGLKIGDRVRRVIDRPKNQPPLCERPVDPSMLRVFPSSLLNLRAWCSAHIPPQVQFPRRLFLPYAEAATPTRATSMPIRSQDQSGISTHLFPESQVRHHRHRTILRTNCLLQTVLWTYRG
jgi:hypothetical protein